MVHERELVAPAVGVEHAVGESTHERALLVAPVAVADALHEHADLAGDAEVAGPAPVHELAHARLADTHARGGFRARHALEVAERGGLALAAIQATAQSLEQLAQPHAVVEIGGEVGLADADCLRLRPGVAPMAGGCLRPAHSIVMRAPARSKLVDGPAERGQHQPPDGVGDLLSFQRGSVKALPGLGVTSLKIVLVKAGAAGLQALAHTGEHPPLQPVELFAQ